MQVTALDDACIFYLASLPCETFQLVKEVFNLFGNGELKGQKTRAQGKQLELKGKFQYIINII